MKIATLDERGSEVLLEQLNGSIQAIENLILQQFCTQLGCPHSLMKREFKQNEFVVWNVIVYLGDEISEVTVSVEASVNLFEHHLITQGLLRRGVRTLEETDGRGDAASKVRGETYPDKYYLVCRSCNKWT